MGLNWIRTPSPAGDEIQLHLLRAKRGNGDAVFHLLGKHMPPIEEVRNLYGKKQGTNT